MSGVVQSKTFLRELDPTEPYCTDVRKPLDHRGANALSGCKEARRAGLLKARSNNSNSPYLESGW